MYSHIQLVYCTKTREVGFVLLEAKGVWFVAVMSFSGSTVMYLEKKALQGCMILVYCFHDVKRGKQLGQSCKGSWWQSQGCSLWPLLTVSQPTAGSLLLFQRQTERLTASSVLKTPIQFRCTVLPCSWACRHALQCFQGPLKGPDISCSRTPWEITLMCQWKRGGETQVSGPFT